MINRILAVAPQGLRKILKYSRGHNALKAAQDTDTGDAKDEADLDYIKASKELAVALNGKGRDGIIERVPLRS